MLEVTRPEGKVECMKWKGWGFSEIEDGADSTSNGGKNGAESNVDWLPSG